MPVLVPAILTREASEVGEQLSFLESFPEIRDVQIDFADGDFVPNRTVFPEEIAKPREKFRIEAHMMVYRPQQHLSDLEELGVQSVIVHHESFRDHDRLESTLRNIKTLGMKAGLAVNPNTEIAVFNQFIDFIDLALIMGVNPGFQGQEFIPETAERLKVLRGTYPDAIIEVDGGVKLENVGEIVGLGIDRVVVGSGIWVTPDPGKTIREFLKILNQ